MKRLFLCILLITTVIIGLYIFILKYQNIKSVFSSKEINSSESNKQLSTLIKLDLKNCKLDILVNPDSVLLVPFNDLFCDIYKLNNLKITSDTYPDLFKQGVAKSSFISIEKAAGSESKIIVSNNQPDHGTYSPTYQLMVNLITAEVTELPLDPSLNTITCTQKLALSKTSSFYGVVHAVDFSAYPEAETFKTVISQSVAKGPNFAGHFNLAYWGCGTDCYGYSVVDSNNGKVIAYSPANEEYHLGNFDISSDYFIMEPVYKNQDRKFYQLMEDAQVPTKLMLACTEKSTKDMYGSAE